MLAGKLEIYVMKWEIGFTMYMSAVWDMGQVFFLLGSPFPSKSCLRVRSSMKAEPLSALFNLFYNFYACIS